MGMDFVLLCTSIWEVCLQRLFSTFPDGVPGTGLLFLRLVASVVLIHHGLIGLLGVRFEAIPCEIISAGAGLLLLVGLWTPMTGALVAFLEVWIAFARPNDLWTSLLLGALGAGLAMLGPGAWSIDARLFGRKRIDIPER
jgi:putative oxidoreductase